LRTPPNANLIPWFFIDLALNCHQTVIQSEPEARRLFYVGVTRPRKELAIVYQEGNPSPWVIELYKRSQHG